MISKKLVFGLFLLVAVGLAIDIYWVRANHDKLKNKSFRKKEG